MATHQKRALITGITGQDGSYLAEFLLGKGYRVFGLMRRTSTDSRGRIPPEAAKKITFIHGSMTDGASLEAALRQARPDEIYNLAAQSHVGVSFTCPWETFEIDYYGVGRLLRASLRICPTARIYQASTSEMFGRSKPPQNEKTPFDPLSPYAEAKVKAYEDFVLPYRSRHGMFIASGILFNHESPRRGEDFVTRKITLGLVRFCLGDRTTLELGNLNAKRDWGYAPEYVAAMWRMLQKKKPDDFVIATGETHTVREFVKAAAVALHVPLRWSGKGLAEVAKDDKGRVVVRINPKFYRPTDVEYLSGDARKAERILGWKPKVTFTELVRLMAEADLEYLVRRGCATRFDGKDYAKA